MSSDYEKSNLSIIIWVTAGLEWGGLGWLLIIMLFMVPIKLFNVVVGFAKPHTRTTGLVRLDLLGPQAVALGPPLATEENATPHNGSFGPDKMGK
jgi:hypothetical protein